MSRSELSILASLVLLAGCDRAATGGEKKGTDDGVKRVVVVKPSRQAIARSVTQPANVLALNEAALYAQVAGYLNEIAVDKGDLVEKDQVLAKIAVPEIEAERKQAAAARAQAEAELVSARAELDRAESTRLAAEAGVKRSQADLDLQKALYDRAKGLRTDGVVSVQDLEIAEGHYKDAVAGLGLADARLDEAACGKREAAAHVEVAKAKVETAAALVDRIDARLGYAKVRAPFKGTISRRFVDPGCMIQQATASSTQASPIVTVVEIDRVRVDFPMPEAEVAHVSTGQRVTLRVEAYPERAFECRVTRFAGALDPATRTMLVEAEYANAENALRPGMFGSATIELERHEDALTLPAEALRAADGEKAVFVVENGAVHRRGVTVGIDSGSTVEITSGLSGGEAIIAGGGRLVDGAPVVAVERKGEK